MAEKFYEGFKKNLRDKINRPRNTSSGRPVLAALKGSLGGKNIAKLRPPKV